MGKTDSQTGQRLTLRCSGCKRTLRIYYNKKNVSSTVKLVVLDGSIHQTEKGTQKIHVNCKCGAKTVFESQSSSITKQGWRRIK
ncbi:hypothetical protein MUO98_06775 [Candidatus Bathyarchaeota archaeon]|nr:hypothetical protein [Candidatus Bathyarchaeota archaeon]